MTERLIAILPEEVLLQEQLKLKYRRKYRAYDKLPHGVAVYFGNDSEPIFRNAFLEGLNPTDAEKISDEINRPFSHTDAGELSRLDAAKGGMKIEADVCIDEQTGPWYKLRIFPDPKLNGKNPQEIFVVIEDNTEQIWERNLRALMLEAATHGAKTPFTSIEAFTGFALDKLSKSIDPDPEMGRLLDGILRSSHNTIRKINNAIDAIERSKKFTKETLAINDILNEVQTNKNDLFKQRGIKARFHLPKQKVLIVGNRIALIATLEILVDNAIEAIPEGCKIKNFTVDCKIEDGQIIMYFIDTGIGISDENHPKIFQEGFTTKPKGSGFGLRFAVAIAKLHRGNLRLVNSVSEEDLRTTPDLGHTGTVFAVSLPLLQENS